MKTLAILLTCSQSVFALGFANGVKIGEVSPDSAVIWTRTTQEAEASNRVKKWTPAQANWTAPGEAAQVRFVLLGTGENSDVLTSPWVQTSAEDDFCHQHRFEDLPASTTFRVFAEARPNKKTQSLSYKAAFTTAPPADSPADLSFTISTCQDFIKRDDVENGHKIYHSMLAVKPSFFIQTGDTLYYDRKRPEARDIQTARYKWNRMYALPYQRELHRQVPTYWMHDDHDLLKDDCWPGQTYGDFTWDQGVQLWNEQIPQSDKPYRTFSWGSKLQIWLPEVRYFRTPNTTEDGPEKTILGAEQWAWLEESLKASDATFKLYVSPTPVVGPDRKSKNDNHSNSSYSYEGQRLRDLLTATPGLIAINGDRHWQYHSIDSKTGLNEFGCGPASDSHAAGWNPKNKTAEHQFLRVAGGFLSAVISGNQLTLRHHDVDGNEVYQHVITAESKDGQAAD